MLTNDAALYTIAFVVPGFLIRWVISGFIPAKKQDAQDVVLQSIILSILNYALCSPIIYFLFATPVKKEKPVAAAVCYGLVILVIPVIAGIAFGYCSKRGFVRRGLVSMGLRPLHHLDYAWDEKFSNVMDREWALVTVQDGTQFLGVFSGNSFASGQCDHRDLFLELSYSWNQESESWEERPDSTGIWFAAGEIKYIEFSEWIDSAGDDKEEGNEQ